MGVPLGMPKKVIRARCMCTALKIVAITPIILFASFVHRQNPIRPLLVALGGRKIAIALTDLAWRLGENRLSGSQAEEAGRNPMQSWPLAHEFIVFRIILAKLLVR